MYNKYGMHCDEVCFRGSNDANIPTRPKKKIKKVMVEWRLTLKKITVT